MLIDLLSCYHHFYLPLPDDYRKFKTNLNSLFPVLYDTKFISHEMKRMEFRDVVDNISLQNLYMTFQDKKDLAFKPTICLETGGMYDKDGVHHAHDAGWDAFMTGFCFIKMMHFLKAAGNKSIEHYSNAELMNVAAPFKNKINIGRAFVPYLQLEWSRSSIEQTSSSCCIIYQQITIKFESFGFVIGRSWYF
uniref:Poly(A)-specific ribonuclease PARN n=1 Tax=Lygus hesperus TaxID=30085 RepID=A0A0A9WHJ1_LYGHE